MKLENKLNGAYNEALFYTIYRVSFHTNCTEKSADQMYI